MIERYHPRFDHDPGTGKPRGLLFEPAVTNALPNSRDMTGWLADGIVSSLSFRHAQQLSGTTIQAEHPRATLLFRADLGQGEYTFSNWIRRIEGHGLVSLTIDGGRSWIDVSAFLLGREWVRVEISNRLARPAVGFHLEESGDAVAVDLSQLEYGSFATSEIIISGTSGFRRREKIMVHYDEDTFLEITWPPSLSIREDRHLLALSVLPTDWNTLEVTLRTKARRCVLCNEANDDVSKSRNV